MKRRRIESALFRWSPEFRAWLEAYNAGAPREVCEELDRRAQDAGARLRAAAIARAEFDYALELALQDVEPAVIAAELADAEGLDIALLRRATQTIERAIALKKEGSCSTS